MANVCPFSLPVSVVPCHFYRLALSHVVCGHRSSIGGGAWESKRGTVAYAMTEVVWDRLADLGYGWAG